LAPNTGQQGMRKQLRRLALSCRVDGEALPLAAPGPAGKGGARDDAATVEKKKKAREIDEAYSASRLNIEGLRGRYAPARKGVEGRGSIQ